VVVEGGLVVVGVAGGGFVAVEGLGEPEHVVGVAGLGALAGLDDAGEIVGGVEVLTLAVAAEGDAAVGDDGIPEEAGGVAPGGVAAELGDAGVADDLGDLGVGVEAGEAVLVEEEG